MSARTFDHDEARALYASGAWTQAALATKFGVSAARINQILDPQRKARVDAASLEWLHENYRLPCANECGTLVWKRGTNDQTGLCRVCFGLSRRTAEHGTESKYSQGCRCAECRAAASKAKRGRREKTRVPCSHDCGAMVDSINRRNPDKPPECLPCALDRIHADQLERAAA